MPADMSHEYPSRYESLLTLHDGREVFLRPIKQTDAPLLIDLFHRISPQSIYQRFLRHMDALPEDMLHRFTHVNYTSDFALVAIAGEGGGDAIISVGRYAFDPRQNVTDLAIAVRDDWQHLGLGKSLLAKVIAIAKENGISRFGSMMDPRNTIIGHTLRDLGYEVKYSLLNGFYQVEIVV